MSEQIKIRYALGERGWAQDMGNGRYKIINVPLTPGLRWGDVVTLQTASGLPFIDEILERPLPHVAVIIYEKTELWPEIVAAFEARHEKGEEYALEGLSGAGPSWDGRALINFNDNVNPRHVLGQIPGVDVQDREHEQ